jgi:hypothetical protein
MNILKQLEKAHYEYKSRHDMIEANVMEALRPIREEVTTGNISTKIVKDFGSTLTTIIPTFSSKRIFSEVTDATIHKACGELTDSWNKRCSNFAPGHLFKYMTQEHVDLIPNDFKRGVAQDFLNLSKAMRAKKPATKDVTHDIHVVGKGYVVELYQHKANTHDPESEQFKYRNIKEERSIVVDRVVMGAVLIGAGSSGYGTRKYSSNPSHKDVQFHIKAYSEKDNVGTVTFNLDDDEIMVTQKNSHYDKGIDFEFENWEEIVYTEQVQKQLMEWVNFLKLSTKSFRFLKQKYAKQLFLSAL